MHYVWDFAILGKYSHLFWLGLGWTMAYTIGTILLGTMLGLLVGILRLKRLPVIDWLLLAYIELFRCTPLLVQIIWFYYAFPVVIGVNIPAHVAAVTVLSLYGGAFYAEIVRGSIESIHVGQWDAARALGLRPWRVLRLVILPQALKMVIPGIVNTFIALFKDTSLVIIIGLFDLLNSVKQATADPAWLGMATEGYVFAALVFWIFCFGMSRYSMHLERKLDTGHKR